MPYEEKRPGPEAAHHIILEEREQLSVSGVEEVLLYILRITGSGL